MMISTKQDEDERYINKELIGQILIKRGLINKKQLQEALELQKSKGGLIGEILVELGYVEDLDIVVALILQCSFPYIAINKYSLDKKILQLIPEDIAREFQVIPLARVGDVLSVVMTDPLDREIKGKLEKITRCRVAAFIATRAQIAEAIEGAYGSK